MKVLYTEPEVINSEEIIDSDVINLDIIYPDENSISRRRYVAVSPVVSVPVAFDAVTGVTGVAELAEAAEVSECRATKPKRHPNKSLNRLTFSDLLRYLTADDVTDLYNVDMGLADPFESTPDRACILNDLAAAILCLRPPHHSLFLIMLAGGYSREDIAVRFNISCTYVRNVIYEARGKLLRVVDKRYKISKYINHNWEM
jgi:hypothetical protein